MEKKNNEKKKAKAAAPDARKPSSRPKFKGKGKPQNKEAAPFNVTLAELFPKFSRLKSRLEKKENARQGKNMTQETLSNGHQKDGSV